MKTIGAAREYLTEPNARPPSNEKPMHLAVLVHAVFAALFLITRRPLRAPDRIAAAWMLLLALPQLPGLLPGFSQGLRFVGAAPLTYGPFLYLYTRALTTPDVPDGRVLTVRDLVHFVPAAFVVLLIFLFPASVSPRSDSILHLTLPVTTLTSFIAYTVVVVRMLGRHELKLVDEFSLVNYTLTLRWLKWVAAAFVLAYVFVAGLSWLPPRPGPSGAPPALLHREPAVQYAGPPPPNGRRLAIDPHQPPPGHGPAFLFFVLLFSFFALRQTAIYPQHVAPDETATPSTEQGTEDPDNGSGTASRYERSGLRPEQAEEHLNALLKYMREEKPYLDGDVTIHDLARHLGLARHHLTQVLNENLGKNFYQFINEYRVEEACELIRNDHEKELTLLAVAFRSGFNTKSAFNSIFKRFTGLSPSEYRERETAVPR